jgi:hypothetical protein
MYQHFARYICEKCGYIETLPLYPAEGNSLLDPIPVYCQKTDQIVQVWFYGKKRNVSCIEEKMRYNCNIRNKICNCPKKNCVASDLKQIPILEIENNGCYGWQVVLQYRCPKHNCGGSMNIDPDSIDRLYDAEGNPAGQLS